jgi:hypothetical protein
MLIHLNDFASYLGSPVICEWNTHLYALAGHYSADHEGFHPLLDDASSPASSNLSSKGNWQWSKSYFVALS